MQRVLIRMERTVDLPSAPAVAGVGIRTYAAETDHHRIPGVFGAAFGREPWPDDWDRFDEFEAEGVFVAEDGDGSLLGFAIGFGRDPGGYISVVAVLSAHRRRRIASALVHAAARRQRDLGREVVRIDAWGDSPAAVGTYLSLGFAPYEVRLDTDD